jgi:hypothetical protein
VRPSCGTTDRGGRACGAGPAIPGCRTAGAAVRSNAPRWTAANSAIRRRAVR